MVMLSRNYGELDIERDLFMGFAIGPAILLRYTSGSVSTQRTWLVP